jgi:hypothetical protein
MGSRHQSPSQPRSRRVMPATCVSSYGASWAGHVRKRNMGSEKTPPLHDKVVLLVVRRGLVVDHELSFRTSAPLGAMPLEQSRFVIRHGGIPRPQHRPRALVRRPTHVEDWHCHSSAADDALAEARAQCVEHINLAYPLPGRRSRVSFCHAVGYAQGLFFSVACISESSSGK